jgi:methionine-rich copper-binding protein CopC
VTTDDSTGRRTGRPARAAAVLAAALLALLWGGAAPAWAHSSLISSSPAADSVLAQAPDRVELVFNEEIRDFQPKLAITVGAADPVEVTPTVDGATVRADLTGLGLATGSDGTPVAWKIGYRVVSADGHPVSGLVTFSVGDGPAPSTTESAAAGSVQAGSDQAGSVQAGGLGSWWWVVGLAVVIAAAGAGWLLLRGRHSARGE